MHSYDRHKARRNSGDARQDAVLDAVVAYRYLAPHKIAADELRAQEMARAALSAHQLGARAAPARTNLMTVLCHRLGTAFVAAGTRLQRIPAASLRPPPPTGSPETPRQLLAESPPHAPTPA